MSATTITTEHASQSTVITLAELRALLDSDGGTFTDKFRIRAPSKVYQGNTRYMTLQRLTSTGSWLPVRVVCVVTTSHKPVYAGSQFQKATLSFTNKGPTERAIMSAYVQLAQIATQLMANEQGRAMRKQYNIAAGAVKTSALQQTTREGIAMDTPIMRVLIPLTKMSFTTYDHTNPITEALTYDTINAFIPIGTKLSMIIDFSNIISSSYGLALRAECMTLNRITVGTVVDTMIGPNQSDLDILNDITEHDEGQEYVE